MITKEDLLKMNGDELKKVFSEIKNDDYTKGCRDCSACDDCSYCDHCSECDRCRDCIRCTRCYDGYRLFDCYDTYFCSECHECYDCYLCKGGSNLKYAICNIELDENEYRAKIIALSLNLDIF